MQGFENTDQTTNKDSDSTHNGSDGRRIDRAANLLPGVFRGTASPTTIPMRVGDIYVDTNNKKIYFATGIASSSDWTVVN